MADDRDIRRTDMDSSEQGEPVGNIGPDADGDRDDRMRGREGMDDESELEEEGNDLQITVQLTGEGVTVEKRYAWRLSQDGQSLTDLNGGLVRVGSTA